MLRGMNLLTKRAITATFKLVVGALSIASVGLGGGHAFSAAADAPTAHPVNDNRQEFDAFARRFRLEQKIPSLSIAISRGDEVLFAGAYGYQDHDAEEPTTTDTSYLAASITKTFTAVTLLAMEADGHISLNDDFTEFTEWDRRCKWLLQSGVIFGGATIDGLTIPKIDCDARITLEHVLSHRVNGVPGADFIYNPIVFGRLSNYIEERTGRSWRSWMRAYVFQPAGLEGIAAGWRDQAGAGVLTHFAPPFKRVDPSVDSDGLVSSALPNTELNASSGIIASPAALARYGVALSRGEILPPKLLERMWSPTAGADGAPEPYGLGWYVEQINGRRVVWHGGWWPDAYAGMLVMVPDEALVFVALGNSDGLHWGNPLNEADITASPLVAEFFRRFMD